MTRGKVDVFISFAEQDVDQAVLIKSALERRGITVWIFKADERGGNIVPHIVSKLREARWIVFLLSRHSVDSYYCQLEATHAFHLCREVSSTVVIPVLIDDLSDDDLRRSYIFNYFPDAWRFERRRALTEEDALELARKIADTLPNDGKVEPQPPVILTTWIADQSAVSIRIAKDHPRWQEARDCLIQKIRTPATDGSWLQSRHAYETRVVPALERILGRGCCPNLPQ